MSADLFGWHRCGDCLEDWPSECFDADRGLCRACAHENPRRVRRPCTRCGRKVQSLDRVPDPTCRPCRRQLAGLRTPHRRAKERKRARRNYQRAKRARIA